MTNLPDTFDRFARRILPADLSDASHLQFQHLAQQHDLAPEAAIEFAEPGQHLVFVGQGATKLIAHASQSRDQIVAFHFTGDVFTVPSADNYSYSLAALLPTRLLAFPAEAFLDLAVNEAGVLRRLLDSSNVSLRRCREKAIAIGRKTATERIAVFLLAMAERIGSPAGGGVVLLNLPMSRRDIAESLGLTIETVSRQFTLLRDARVIGTSGRAEVTLLDLPALQDRAGYLREAA